MDIQKEREAFECEFKQTDYYIAHGDLSTLMLCDDQYALDDVQVSFEMWQAAKAQAVPEGFVLVKVSDIAKLAIAVSRVDLMTYSEERPDSEKLAWQNVANKLEAMIEAQEPAND